jgi:SOS-response transcriptional repressor LexA
MTMEDVEVRPMTARQRDVLREIVRYVRAIGEAPSQHFVARRLGLHHSRIQQHLQALYEKGWLRSPTTGGLRCMHNAVAETARPPTLAKSASSMK